MSDSFEFFTVARLKFLNVKGVSLTKNELKQFYLNSIEYALMQQDFLFGNT